MIKYLILVLVIWIILYYMLATECLECFDPYLSTVDSDMTIVEFTEKPRAFNTKYGPSLLTPWKKD